MLRIIRREEQFACQMQRQIHHFMAPLGPAVVCANTKPSYKGMWTSCKRV